MRRHPSRNLIDVRAEEPDFCGYNVDDFAGGVAGEALPLTKLRGLNTLTRTKNLRAPVVTGTRRL